MRIRHNLRSWPRCLVALVVAVALSTGCGAEGGPDRVGAGSSSASTNADWTWPEGIPGTPVAVDEGLTAGAGDGIDLSTLRQVVSSRSAQAPHQLFAARSSSGTVCIRARGHYIDGPFWCLGPNYSSEALAIDKMAGGASPTKVDFVSVVGVTRSDVARVAAVFRSGASEDIALNRWRGFAYMATGSRAHAVELIAYGEDGSELGRIDISSDPPSSGP